MAFWARKIRIGYDASFTYTFTSHVGMEAPFTGHNGSFTQDSEVATSENEGFRDPGKQGLYVYTFGPRLSLPTGNFSLFSHFLVGATHVTENFSDTSTPPTGGADALSRIKASFMEPVSRLRPAAASTDTTAGGESEFWRWTTFTASFPRR
jgi:hypothetical protein